MREQLRGYAQGVKYLAQRGGVSNLDHQVVVLADFVHENAELREIVSDPSITSEVRGEIIADLFSDSLSEFAIAVARASFEIEEPGKVVEALIMLGQVLGEPLEAATGALTTTSRVRAYGRALLESMDGPGAIGAAEEMIFDFRNLVEANPKLRRALSGIGTNASQRVGIVDDLLGHGSDDTSQKFIEIMRFCASAGRIRDIVDVLDKIITIAAHLRNTKIAHVRVAKALDDQQLSLVTSALSRLSGAAIEVREVVDESVVGGVVAVVGDTIYDGSIRHRLEQLKGRMQMATATR
ncbi:ATP synthase F1 subunit delta [Acidithrix sp. C25]|uniref:ATP synthase F1 subunit delta n=1 Tax=Acidithrix sp. C25 TaxID=1671482 RepID=UPI00191B8F8C|nr:ATP synthase F1 subunit delta [Acidithrix sp. C25]CAG4929386.1 unnamed protein product [Acidithrix sp. C25]